MILLIPVPGVCFADDLGRVPRILRVCEVPKPDAVKAESVSALLAFLASQCYYANRIAHRFRYIVFFNLQDYV